MSEYTPGPWAKGRDDMTTAHDDPDVPFRKDIYADDVSVRVHHVDGEPLPMVVGSAYGRTPEEAHANGRVIAAAPDLLAAAERACKMLDQEFDDRVANIETTRAFLVLQDAISKARGTDDA